MLDSLYAFLHVLRLAIVSHPFDFAYAVLLLALFFTSICRVSHLSPKETKTSVAVYFIAIAFGCWIGVVSLMWGLLHPENEIFLHTARLAPVAGMAVAMLVSASRWFKTAPAGTARAQ